MNTRGKVDIVWQPLLRGILNPRATWEKMYSDGHDLGDKLAYPGRKTLHSAELPQIPTSNKRFRWRP